MLFSTPLRTDLAGHVRPGLCTSWRATGTLWRLRCRHAGAIAIQLRHSGLFPGAFAVKGELRLPTSEQDVPLPPDRGAGGTARACPGRSG